MGEKGMSEKINPHEPDIADLKALGRAKADELQARIRDGGGDDFAWFDALYESAEGRRGFIPWSEAAPRFKLIDWLSSRRADLSKIGDAPRLRAIDVGCGLGDNASCLAAAGYDVTAFDISAHAVEWARKNLPDSGIKFEVADIFDLPDHWRGGFDLVHETYNLQAMPNHVAPAIDAIASLVAPGGTLLVMTRGRHDDEHIEGPPRPLTKKQLQGFEAAGLECRKFEEFYSEGDRPVFHYLAEYVRSADD